MHALVENGTWMSLTEELNDFASSPVFIQAVHFFLCYVSIFSFMI